MTDVSEHIWWYFSRSAGIAAWMMLCASVVWGVVLAADLFSKQRRPAWLLGTHRWLAALACWFTAAHMVALIGDNWTHFTVIDLLVPGRSEWKSVPVALGVVAFWLLAVVQGTSLAMKKMPRKVWKLIHMLSFGIWALVAFHMAFAGTDSANTVMRVVNVLIIGFMISAFAYRSLQANLPKKAGKSRVPAGMREPRGTGEPAPEAGST